MKTDTDTIRELAAANSDLACQVQDLARYHQAQRIISQAVEKRGYRLGWTVEQFIARQVVKLGEELGELATTVNLPYDGVCLTESGATCRELFDHIKIWGVVPSNTDAEKAKGEAADMLVVLFNLSAAIEDLTGEPFDLVQAAIDKATSDQKRGVR